MNISFAWTTPAVVLGEKTETRRRWSGKTIDQYYDIACGQACVDAWDKSPRFGGKQFGVVRIHKLVGEEWTCDIPDKSWELEGFHILTPLGAKIDGKTPEQLWREWRNDQDLKLTVVGFDLVSLNDYGKELRDASQRAFEESGSQTWHWQQMLAPKARVEG